MKRLELLTYRFGASMAVRDLEDVAAAKEAYRAGYAPYHKVLEDTVPQLLPRGPRGSPWNYERNRQVGEALHNERMRREGQEGERPS
jgi:hypothetical protein